MNLKNPFIAIFLLALPGIGLSLLVIRFVHAYRSPNWSFIVGMLAVFFAAIFILGLISLGRTVLADKKCLFYALLFFPGLAQLFAGAGMLAMEYSHWLTTLFTVGLLLSFAAGVLMTFKSSLRSRSQV
jgi:hypothetical protein